MQIFLCRTVVFELLKEYNYSVAIDGNWVVIRKHKSLVATNTPSAEPLRKRGGAGVVGTERENREIEKD